MPPPSQQQQPQGDNSLGPLWITIGLFALVGIIWYVFHRQIVYFFLEIKYIEAAFIALFDAKLIPAMLAMKTINPSDVSFPQLTQYAQVVGSYARYPLGFIMVTLAVVLFLGHPAMRFKRTHSMQTLLDQERYNWPQIMPVYNVDLVKQSIEKGAWSMALTPMQFAKKYNLLQEERSNTPGVSAQRQTISVTLRRAEAYQVFALQLGNYWTGIDSLNMHTKALFTIFACRINQDPTNAKLLTDQINLSVATGHLDFSNVDEILNKYRNSPIVKDIIGKYAFVLTVMGSMLLAARQDGVVASADFLWLKVVDRPLWFVLNTVGRQTPPCEVAGIFAHWVSERRLGRRIGVPMVDEAVKALDISLKEAIYVPDEKQE